MKTRWHSVVCFVLICFGVYFVTADERYKAYITKEITLNDNTSNTSGYDEHNNENGRINIYNGTYILQEKQKSNAPRNMSYSSGPVATSDVSQTVENLGYDSRSNDSYISKTQRLGEIDITYFDKDANHSDMCWGLNRHTILLNMLSKYAYNTYSDNADKQWYRYILHELETLLLAQQTGMERGIFNYVSSSKALYHGIHSTISSMSRHWKQECVFPYATYMHNSSIFSFSGERVIFSYEGSRVLFCALVYGNYYVQW